MLDPLKAAEKALEKLKQSSPLAKAWTIENKFKLHCKKAFADAEVKKEGAKLLEGGSLVDRLEEEAQAIKAMQAARPVRS